MPAEHGLDRWRGATAVVTGASSGIGRAVAIALGDAGIKVAVWARREEPLKLLADRLRAAGTEVITRCVDLREPNEIGAAFDEVRGRWGGVTLMVNNAGIGYREPLLTGETEHWREMVDVNILALCICVREAVADMRRMGDRGHVVNLSSMASHRVPLGSGVYSATKYAVRSLTEGLRLELRAAGSNIRVSSISPGLVETEFGPRYFGSPESAQKQYGDKPILQPEDIARLVIDMIAQPDHVQIHDILVRSTHQPH